MSATRGRLVRTGVAVLAAVLPRVLAAQDGTQIAAHADTTAPTTMPTTSYRTARFLGGAATAFVAHESGHVVANLAFGARMAVRRVEFQGVPFFAIRHSPDVTPRQEFVISSAGFWVQHATSEWILTRHPQLRHESRPFLKGMLAFNVLTSVGYAGAAVIRTGPAERDTRSMAVSARVGEGAIGALILVPAAADLLRYWRPETPGVVWLSRGAKIGAVLLAAR